MSVIFKQLRISGKNMFLSCRINQASYYDNAYIKRITIMSADRVLETNPYQPTEEYLWQSDEYDSSTREVDLTFEGSTDFLKRWMPTAQEMLFKNEEMQETLFFVYVEVDGISSDAPCGMDNIYTIGITFDGYVLHQRTMDYTKQLSSDCTIPTGFVDFILLWNAFKSSIETGHYIPAINFFNMLFANGRWSKKGGCAPVSTKNCGCYG